MTYTQPTENNTPITAAADNIFDTFKERLFNFAKQFEYTVDIDADQVFPNNTIKDTILKRYRLQHKQLSSQLQFFLLF